MNHPQDLTLVLPFPPSVNAYWRNAGRTLLSKRARIFHELAQKQMFAQMIRSRKPKFAPFNEPVAVDICLYPPDRKRRDLDNFIKALLDSLTRCQVWLDDSLVHDLHLAWQKPEKPGKAVIRIISFDAFPE